MEYLWLKFFHILSVIGWVSSTLSLGLYLIYETIIVKRFDCQHRVRIFYKFLTVFEIIFFILTVIFGLLMMKVAGYSFDIKWIRSKVLVVLSVFLPLELINIYLVWKMKTVEDYEKYDRFVLYITPALVVAGATVVYMAVFKIN